MSSTQPPSPPTPAPNNGQPARAAHAAVPVFRIVALILNIPILVVLAVAIITQPVGAEATGAQPSPTWTAQPIYTTAPAPTLTPQPAATPTRTPHSSGPPRANPTPTSTPRPAPTAPPLPTATSQPTPLPGGG